MEETVETERPLRTTASSTQAGDWALVLAAAGIEYQVDERDGHFALLVPPAEAVRAAQALAEFDAEGAPEVAPPAPDRGPSALGVMAAVAFSAMFLLTGTREAASRWFDVGSASAELITRGAWWRAVTALTLHADLYHLLGNVLASLVFITAVGRWLGGGLGAVLILVTATIANFATAAVHRTAFVSVGASTATFAAVGLVAGLQVVRRLKLRTRRAYAWVPIGAGLALYAMLGVGPNADRYAHLFGLGFGSAAGLGAAAAQLSGGWRAPGAVAQVLLGAAVLAFVALAWRLALRA